jgi:cell division protein FtsW (lipid II flippase)
MSHTSRREERLLLALPLLGAVAGVGSVMVATGAPTVLQAALALGVLWGVALGLHALLASRRPHADAVLLALAVALLGAGLVMLARTAPQLLERQALWIVVSGLALAGTLFWPARLAQLARYKYTCLVAGLAIVALTLLFGSDPNGSGARLWLVFGPVQFQASELLKLLLVIFLAAYLTENRELLRQTPLPIGRWSFLPPVYAGPLVVMAGLSLLLLAAQDDFGAALLLYGLCLTMLYMATGQRRDVLLGLALFLIAAVGVATLSTRVALRVANWWDPLADPLGRGYQSTQAMLALAWGGVFGQGPQGSLPELLPAAHTDFPLAAIGEQFGLAGTLALIGLYVLLALRGWTIALRARRPFARLLAAGLTAMLALQAWLIMAGTLRVIPLTGITLPFVSYGGSSLLINSLALGLLLRVADDSGGG